MTPTEVARRSDALYEDNSGGMTRRTLCDMVAQREAENAKLRELANIGELAANECSRLAEQNAKLRKLVQDFDKCLTEAVRLVYIQGHMTIYDGTLLDSLHPRMCELGIEVDG